MKVELTNEEKKYILASMRYLIKNDNEYPWKNNVKKVLEKLEKI